jgi:hypothetical protein
LQIQLEAIEDSIASADGKATEDLDATVYSAKRALTAAMDTYPQVDCPQDAKAVGGINSLQFAHHISAAQSAVRAACITVVMEGLVQDGCKSLMVGELQVRVESIWHSCFFLFHGVCAILSLNLELAGWYWCGITGVYIRKGVPSLCPTVHT